MGFPRHIFKAYDIRGLVGSEVTPELAEAVGRAFPPLTKGGRGGVADVTIAVGRDMRKSSLALQKALVKGLTSVGAQVIDMGLVSTPAFYFGVGHTQADGGVMVSASHNPAEFNGFKLTRANAVPVSGETGIQELAAMIETRPPLTPPYKGGGLEVIPPLNKGGQGGVKRIGDIPAKAVKVEMALAGEYPIEPFTIVADTANGMGAQYLDEFFRHIDTKRIEKLFWKFDGLFPNHEADPLKDENVAALKEKVKEIGADVGIATDGDGDRIFFVDDEGEVVPPQVLRGLIAQIVLRKHPGATICYDVRPGRVTVDMIEQAGGKPVMTRVGHSLIKEKMREVGAVFGGESSGHFFFSFPPFSKGGSRGGSEAAGRSFAVYEAPVTVAMMLLQEMTRQGKPLSQIVAPYKNKYVHSGEINFNVSDKDAALTAIKKKYRDGELSELDGVSITYPDFWFNVRASNTENKLRLNLEAVDRKTMEHRRNELASVIASPS